MVCSITEHTSRKLGQCGSQKSNCSLGFLFVSAQIVKLLLALPTAVSLRAAKSEQPVTVRL